MPVQKHSKLGRLDVLLDPLGQHRAVLQANRPHLARRRFATGRHRVDDLTDKLVGQPSQTRPVIWTTALQAKLLRRFDVATRGLAVNAASVCNRTKSMPNLPDTQNFSNLSHHNHPERHRCPRKSSREVCDIAGQVCRSVVPSSWPNSGPILLAELGPGWVI